MKTLNHTNEALIEQIIRSCDVCYAGMIDQTGMPYVIPMNFGYNNGIIYLHSAQEGSCIEMLEHNPKICITFCTERELVYQHPEVACSYRMRTKSVICRGVVEFVEEPEQKREALDILMKQYTDRTFVYSEPSVRNVKIWRVKPESIGCKEFGAPHDKSFYRKKSPFSIN